MASGDIKGFYKQKKKGGVTKPSSSSSKKRSAKSGGGPTLASPDPIQSPALIAHGSLDLQDEYGEEEEEKLRQFDMDMRYGPCLGLSRMERWERASSMGLNPPSDVENLLRSGVKAGLECLWDGRV